jgi:hypothetical protein
MNNKKPGDVAKNVALDSSYQAVVTQMCLVLAAKNLNWTNYSNNAQIIYKIGHTFTEVPRFENDLADRLSEDLRKILKKLGYDNQEAINQCKASIDRGEGEIIIDLDQSIKETIQELIDPFAKELVRARNLRTDLRHR